MITEFHEQYRKVQVALEDGRQEQLIAQARMRELAQRQMTLAIGRRFQRAGVARRRSGWYVADDGRLAQDC